MADQHASEEAPRPMMQSVWPSKAGEGTVPLLDDTVQPGDLASPAPSCTSEEADRG